METKSVILGADQKVAKVEFKDGTIFERLGPQRWVANDDHPRRHEWIGDVIVAASGKLRFQYKYPKSLSQCNLEIRFQDGRKLALRKADGQLVCPSTINHPSIKTLEETAMSSISKLGNHIYEGAKRLRLTGVSSAEGMLNINYLLLLNSSEERPVIQALAKSEELFGDGSSFELVAADKSLPFASPPGESNQTHAFHSETAYYYDEPRPEHTATTVIFFIEEQSNRLRVVTGIRGGEPCKGQEALPGGFVDVHGTKVENVYDAAAREVREETGGQVQKLQLLRVADARKDPRNQVIDSQFIAKITRAEFEQLQAGDDIAKLHARDVSDLLAEPERMAFDHGEALGFALAACKTRPDLRAAAYNTARDTEYKKAIFKLRARYQSPAETTAELLIQVLTFLMNSPPLAKDENTRELVENAIKRLNPSISVGDLDYTRARVMQIQYEEIDYALSKAGWTAAAGSDGSISGSFRIGSVLLDPGQSMPFGEKTVQLDEVIPIPADVIAAISIASTYEDQNPTDRETIKNLEKVLQSDLEQRHLLETGYKKAIGNSTQTRPSALIAFFLSYCGRKPEDSSN